MRINSWETRRLVASNEMMDRRVANRFSLLCVFCPGQRLVPIQFACCSGWV